MKGYPIRPSRLLAPALFAAVGLAVTAPAVAARAPALPAAAKAALAPVLADPRRKDDAARDVWRHPEAVLALCRIEPGMKVVDYMPGGGWWTKILVPYLGESGRYIALNPDVRAATPQLQQFLGNLAGTFPAKVSGWTGAAPGRFDVFNTDGLPAALDGTVDRVMIMRQVHNMHRLGMLFAEMTALRRLLKPGGLLCIEEHRAKPNASADYADGSKGYVRQADVIALMQAHGFDLAASSEINANPKDSADYPEGVWVLPPTFALRDKNRAGYEAIGEADRMTLLFRRRP